VTDDETLCVARAIDGDRAALGALLARYAPLVAAHLRRYRLSAADAADVAQTAAEHAVRAIGSLRDTSAFGAWVCRIAAHAAVGHIRRERARGAADHAEIYDEAPPDSLVCVDTALDILSRGEDITALAAAVRALRPVPRDVVVRHLDGETIAEIGAAHGRPADWANTTLANASKALARGLGLPRGAVRFARIPTSGVRARRVDLVGRRFGALVVVAPAAAGSGQGVGSWEVRCDCGVTRVSRGHYLTTGRQVSCGRRVCLHAARALLKVA
jgi:RNA polymerase sigma factor (sigma-70 family)